MEQEHFRPRSGGHQGGAGRTEHRSFRNMAASVTYLERHHGKELGEGREALGH